MVTVIDYLQRQNAKGEDFFMLELQGEMEIVTSAQTGMAYATARKAKLPTTFNEATCASMVGKELPGSIKRVDCEPYEYTISESGETIELSHRWEYVSTEVQIPKLPFSENGLKVAWRSMVSIHPILFGVEGGWMLLVFRKTIAD